MNDNDEERKLAGRRDSIEPSSFSSTKSIKQLWIQFALSKWSLVIGLLIFALLWGVPLYHAYTETIPPEKDLFISEGELFFEQVPGRGSLTGVKTTDGIVVVSCRSLFGNDNSCVSLTPAQEKVRGKPAVIKWYKRNIFLWQTQDTLVELLVENRHIINRSDFLIKNERGKKWFFWAGLVMLLVSLGMDRWYKKCLRGKNSGCNNI